MPASSRPRSGPKRGFTIPTAILIGGVILMGLTALSFFSQGEMRSVKALLGKTTAEYTAYTGLMWAYERLCRRGRWYQPADNSFDTRGKKWKSSWFGPPEGDLSDQSVVPFANTPHRKVTIFIDEIRSTRTQQVKGKIINGGAGLPLLDHLKVLALAETAGEKALIFGKLIMMPEPLLNSNSLTGASPDDPQDPEGDKYVIRVPPIRNQKVPLGSRIIPGSIWSQDMNLTDRVRITRVLFSKGSKVRMEDYVVQFSTECAGSPPNWATQEPKMRARYDGVVDEVLVAPGDIKKEGDPLAVIRKNTIRRGALIPLKKMVRITRIPLSVFKDLDLTRRKHRAQVHAYIARQKDQFLRNYRLANDVAPGIESFFDSLNGGKRIKSLKESSLPTIPGVLADSNESATASLNIFVRNMINGFIPPLGMNASTSQQFTKTNYFALGIEPREITATLKELLQIHGQRHHGNPDHYLRMLDTLPKRLLREGTNIYVIGSDTAYAGGKEGGAVSRYYEIMGKYSGANHKEDDPDTFIEKFGTLKHASVYANIYLNQGTCWEPPTFQDMVDRGEITDPENYFRWKNSKGEDGFWKYAPPEAVTIKPVDVPFYYENATPYEDKPVDQEEDPNWEKNARHFRMRMTDLMRFHKKYYDEGGTAETYEELRPDDDIEDSPQAPGPPDSTGASFSGVSS